MAIPDVQLSVEVCGLVPNVTLVGDSVQVRPAGVDADTVSPTVPVKPFRAVTVIVEVPEPPAKIWLGLTGPALIVKSTTVKVMAAVA